MYWVCEADVAAEGEQPWLVLVRADTEEEAVGIACASAAAHDLTWWPKQVWTARPLDGEDGPIVMTRP